VDLLRVEHRHKELADVDFSGQTFDTFGAYGGTFLRCDFTDTSFGRFSVGHQGQTHFVDCVFQRTRFPLGNTYFGNTRFERCRFDHARLRDLRIDSAEFIDCVFHGRVWHTTFYGAPEGWTTSPDRPDNRWHGNDFSGADLVDVAFCNIDLRAQRWPNDRSEYALIDRIDERTAAAAAAIRARPEHEWPDRTSCEQALRAVHYLRTGAHRDPGGFILIRRRMLGNRLPPHVRDLLWTLLVTNYSDHHE
jgi:hypothetical protein